MLSLTVVTLFVVAVGLIWWLAQDGDGKGKKKIPGPMGLPILGNVLQLGTAQHIKYAEWTKKYGDIFKIRFGNKLAVVISDPKMLKEIFTTDPVFAGRKMLGLDVFPNEPLGIVTTEGEYWETHRRFLLRNLRDFGFGKSTMEQLMIGEVNETISRFEKIQKEKGCVYDVKEIFLVAVVNSLFNILASKRFEQDDPRLLAIMSLSDGVSKEIANEAIAMMIPWTRIFLGKSKNVEIFREKHVQFYKDMVDEHKATFQEGTIRDFVDVYLNEVNVQKDKPGSHFSGSKAYRQLVATLADLHTAGSDTTATTLTWGVLYLAKFPEVQKKFQKEIEEITGGNSRQVSVTDRPNMPFTLALIDEVLRMSSIVPTGVQHNTTLGGREFRGYWIPKDTWVFPNLHYIHHNPKIWGDPEKFRPERFLTEDGKKYQKSENLMPFQIGRRQCVGEIMARDNIFLFLTNIFQKFEVQLDPSKPEPSLIPQPAFILAPDRYSVVLKERK